MTLETSEKRRNGRNCRNGRHPHRVPAIHLPVNLHAVHPPLSRRPHTATAAGLLTLPALARIAAAASCYRHPSYVHGVSPRTAATEPTPSYPPGTFVDDVCPRPTGCDQHHAQKQPKSGWGSLLGVGSKPGKIAKQSPQPLPQYTKFVDISLPLETGASSDPEGICRAKIKYFDHQQGFYDSAIGRYE